MLKYAFRSVVAVMLANWYGKSISQSTDMTQTCTYSTSYVCDPTNTKTETRKEMSLQIIIRVYGMLGYAFISAVPIGMGKAFHKVPI